ncbi:hypothetical protein DPMN_145092 [Dreissena polymorpha]|uniref:Uncharacterized protein n=1 Tax=Dreissena polymorpha TaxID=45954 RepID=A0A9D4F3A7_DREPO|nr:hypothetical protein DPMN_145092 [Dreissena polymorpha]
MKKQALISNGVLWFAEETASRRDSIGIQGIRVQSASTCFQWGPLGLLKRQQAEETVLGYKESGCKVQALVSNGVLWVCRRDS